MHCVINRNIFVHKHFQCFFLTPPFDMNPPHSFINETPDLVVTLEHNYIPVVCCVPSNLIYYMAKYDLLNWDSTWAVTCVPENTSAGEEADEGSLVVLRDSGCFRSKMIYHPVHFRST